MKKKMVLSDLKFQIQVMIELLLWINIRLLKFWDKK